ncbi:MAG: zf-HC2 domain-containing protein [Pseudonocardiales bacterium]|nr:zf-HC2 domain-containing protein [Pseudonocardiales bacterium]
MTELTCDQCGQLAAELVLHALTEGERARVLAHLDGCPSCRDTVSALTTIANQIIELLPPVQPPAGFEQWVVTALARLQSQQDPNGVGSKQPENQQI